MGRERDKKRKRKRQREREREYIDIKYDHKSIKGDLEYYRET